jgi:hypothetical protein
MGAYPFAFAWLYLRAADNRGAVIRILSIMLATLILTISPWLVRNYCVFGRFVFIKSNFGNELFLGTRDPIWGHNAQSFHDDSSTLPLTELERSNAATHNRVLFQKALDFIREHPLWFARQAIQRFIQFWSFMRPQHSLKPEFNRAAIASLGMYFLILILAIAGLLLSNIKEHTIQLTLLFLFSLPVPYYSLL